MSTTYVPGLAPWMTPASPRITSRTCGESGTMVMTSSLASATAAGVGA